MDMKNRGTVYYVCFYAEPEFAEQIISYPSVWSKIDYIASALKRKGRKVAIVSMAQSVHGVFHRFSKKVDENESHHYFSSRFFSNRLLQKISIILQWMKIVLYLLNNVKKDDSVIIYHSLYNRWWLKIYRNVFRKHFTLEIEDVFSSLSEANRSYQNQEWRLFQLADQCICVNEIIASQLGDAKHTIISYGSYALPEKYASPEHACIRLVYAGVIEQVRNAAFLAVKTMQYLPSEYELHILGFGNDDDLSALTLLIEEINRKQGREAVFYHGKMMGSAYEEFLQNCDIGLSTHMYDTENMDSANHTFPSKVLVYMANGLHVVAQRLACLEQSEISDYLTFYDTPAEISVAKAIQSINLETDSRGRELISKMDEEFTVKISSILNKS